MILMHDPVATQGLFGKETYVPCRMCNGAGRLYLTERKTT
jgi:hypothetical protein